MTSKQRIYRLLEPLKLYALKGGTLVDAELAAYLAAFEAVENGLKQLYTGAFAALCDSQQLKRWERMTGLPVKEEIPLEQRRHMVLERLAVSPRGFTVAGLEKALASAGITAQVQELPGQGKIRIISHGITGGYYTLDEVRRAINRFLPCHLEAELDFGSLTWEMFDEKDRTFQQWDEKKTTWEYFDLNGEML